MVISWMAEALSGLPAALLDPEYRGPIFAILVLVVLYSVVSSIRRLRKAVASVSEDLSAIRSTLRKIERSLGRTEWAPGPGDKEGDAIRDLLFRWEDGRSEKDR